METEAKPQEATKYSFTTLDASFLFALGSLIIAAVILFFGSAYKKSEYESLARFEARPEVSAITGLRANPSWGYPHASGLENNPGLQALENKLIASDDYAKWCLNEFDGFKLSLFGYIALPSECQDLADRRYEWGLARKKLIVEFYKADLDRKKKESIEMMKRLDIDTSNN